MGIKIEEDENDEKGRIYISLKRSEQRNIDSLSVRLLDLLL